MILGSWFVCPSNFEFSVLGVWWVVKSKERLEVEVLEGVSDIFGFGFNC